MNPAPFPSSVRTRLIAAGLAIGLVGGGLVAAVVLGLAGSSTAVTTSISEEIFSGVTDNWTLHLTPTSHGTLALTWTSSAPATVSLWRAGPCATAPGTCATGPALAEWGRSGSGQWSTSGAIGGLYVLSASNAGNTTLTLNAAETETYTNSGTTMSVAVVWLVLIGAALLLTVGGVAVFLGLFLTTGVYAERPPAPRDDFAADRWDGSEPEDPVQRR